MDVLDSLKQRYSAMLVFFESPLPPPSRSFSVRPRVEVRAISGSLKLMIGCYVFRRKIMWVPLPKELQVLGAPP